MDLTSQAFTLLFLPLALAFFALTGRAARAAVAGLVILSLVYYALADWAGLPALLASMAINYGLGLLLARMTAPVRRDRPAAAVLTLGIAVNIALLAWVKYAGTDSLIIPLGVSFFTFQQIIYLVDVYRDEPPARNPLDYAMFVAFFPKITAGPLLRHGDFLPQLARPRFSWQVRTFNFGAALVAIGLVKKVVLAGSLAPYAGRVFDAASAGAAPAAADAWSASLAYALQLYFDFSGYSDMAIGIAAMFGLILPFNFNSPYRAASLIDFWKRWHITLSTALFEFVYFPIAASAKRGDTVRPYVAVLFTMFVCGVWHGAGLTFVVWGVLHGLLLCVNHAWRAYRGRRRGPMALPVRLLSTAATFLCVLVAWNFFRADTVAAAVSVSAGMLGANGLGTGATFAGDAAWWRAWGLVAGGLAIVWLLPNSQRWADMAAALGGPAAATSAGEAVARPPQTGWPRVRRLATATVLSIVALAGGLFGIEWILGRFVFAPMQVADCTTALTPHTLVLRPGCRGEMFHPDYGRLPYVTNSLGMRDQEYDAATYASRAGGQRVLAVGNSFTFGAGVEGNQVFHALVEQRDPQVVIFNAGYTVGIEGSADVVEHFAPRIHPDLVLLTLGTADVAQFSPDVRAAPSGERRRTLAVLAQFVKEQVLPPHVILLAKGLVSDDWLAIYRHQLDPDTAERYDRFVATIAQMQRTLDAAEPPIPLAVLIIPQVEQVNGFLDRRDDASPTASSRHLRSRLEGLGIPVIDSVPYFLTLRGAADLFYPRDRHLTVEGHRRLAEFLQPELDKLRAAAPAASRGSDAHTTAAARSADR